MKVYFQFLPEGIVIRRKGDGQTDPIVTTITPEALIELAETDDDWGRRSSMARREHGLPPLPSFIGEERGRNA